MSGYIGSYEIDDLCTFYANTHTPSTGAAVDADAVPGYRVYEHETGTPILSGSMALLDDANTVGFYSEQITLSAANGFEAGKSYCIRKTLVVGGVTGVDLDKLQIGAKVDMQRLSGSTQSATDLKDFADAGYDPDTNKVQGVALVDTLTTYTDNTVQTGDNYQKIDTEIATIIATLAGLSTLDAAGVRTAVGLASANLDTQLGDLPTNGELATALGTSDDAVLVAIAALNNLSPTGVRTALGVASANLDTQLGAIAGFIDTEVAAIVSAIEALHNLSSAQAQTAAAAALTAYPAATTAQVAAVTSTLAGTILDVNVQQINDVTILGDGSATPFHV